MSKKKRKERKEQRKAKHDAIKGKVTARLLFAPLAPYRKAMLFALKGKGAGVNQSSTTQAIAIAFYNKVVLKVNNYELDMLDDKSGASGGDGMPVDDAKAGIIKGIIGGIVTWFKSLKARKDSGQNISAAEQRILDLEATGQGAAERAEDAATDSEVGSIVTEYWWAILLFIYFFFVRKK